METGDAPDAGELDGRERDPTLRIRLLGGLRVEAGGRELELPPGKRIRALLALLALERGPHARGQLAARFWPDVLDESARTSLRTALTALRRALGEDADRWLHATRDEVRLAADVWTDVDELNERLAAGDAESALELAGGPLLAGLDDDWVLERRDDLRDRVGRALAEQATGAEQAGDLHAAIELTRRWAGLDALDEQAGRELIRRLAATGERAGALTAYERLRERLAKELRMVPSAATRELAEAVREGSGPAQPGVPANPPAPAARPSASGAAGGGTVTLLFTDLVGSTALLSQVGDDEAERQRREHFGLLRDVIGAHEGDEVKNLGDGLMVVFASAVDAVACATGIQRALARHARRGGNAGLQVRVGLNAGEPFRDEDDWFGTPVVVAKRLCDSADGGQVLASDLVRALVGTRGGHQFRPLGTVELKGISEPVGASEVLWAEAEEQRIPLPAMIAAPEPVDLIGRDAALEDLRTVWEQARAGSARLVLLAGEPGIGKTRLAAEFCRAVHAEAGALVLAGRCFEEPAGPYLPFVAALEHYVTAAPADELRVAVGREGALLARLLPAVRPRLRLSEHVESDDPELERYRLFEAVAALIRGAADASPTVLLLDDLHWAEAPELQLLAHLMRTVAETPLLVVGTYRATEVGDEHPLAAVYSDLRRRDLAKRIDLDGLDPDEVEALIGAQAGRAVPPQFAAAVAERTEGNPLFVQELLRDLPSGTPWPAAAGIGAVPETVRDLIRRRLSGLDDVSLRVVTAGAVLGREFDLALLARVTETDEDELIDRLEDAGGAHVVRETAGRAGTYEFAHALIQEVLYNGIPAARRARLHARAGEALETLRPEALDENAPALARHFQEAEDFERALGYRRRAMLAAQGVQALTSAWDHCEQALALARRLGRNAAQDADTRELLLERAWLAVRMEAESGPQDAEAALAAAREAGDRRAEARGLLLRAYMLHGEDMAAALDDLAAALSLAEDLGDRERQVEILNRMALLHASRLTLDEAVDRGERALALAREIGTPEVVSRGLDGLKLTALRLGDVERLEAVTDELLALTKDEPWMRAYVLIEAAWGPIGRARPQQALERAEIAVAGAKATRTRAILGMALDVRSAAHRCAGDYAAALCDGRQALALVAGSMAFGSWMSAGLGTTLLDVGDPAGAVGVLAPGLEHGQAAAWTAEIVRCAGPLAYARHLTGDDSAAAAAAAVATDALAAGSYPAGGAFLFGSDAIVALARFHLATGDVAAALAVAAPLLAAGEVLGWQPAVAGGALVLGLAAEAEGRHAEAVALLGRAAEAGAAGWPASARWEALAARARVHAAADRSDDAAADRTAAQLVVDEVCTSLADETLRASFNARVRTVLS